MTARFRMPRAVVTFALSLAVVLSPVAANAATAPAPVRVPSAMVMTMDGSQAIWSRRASAKRPVASTIKMLNALVVIENASLDETVTVTKKAALIEDGDVGLYVGQKVTVRRLLQMMLVASANDAAEALAIHIAGSESAYVRMMNAKAASLGLRRTRAVDPHGLSKRERSTAADLVVLARNVMAQPALREIVVMDRVRVPRRNGTTAVYRSTNRLLGRYEGLSGLKTGYTIPAGFCLVAVAKRGDVELVGVVLGAKTNAARFTEMRKLLDYGFAHYVRPPAPAPIPAPPMPSDPATSTPSAPTTPSVTPSSTVSAMVFAY